MVVAINQGEVSVISHYRVEEAENKMKKLVLGMDDSGPSHGVPMYVTLFSAFFYPFFFTLQCVCMCTHLLTVMMSWLSLFSLVLYHLKDIRPSTSALSVTQHKVV